MAAYSAVLCFRQTLKQLLDSGELHLPSQKTQIEKLYEKVSSLKSSFDIIVFVPKDKRDGMKEVQNEIREAIYAAQDEVERSIKGHSSQMSDGISLEEISEAIGQVEEKAKKVAGEISNDPQAQNLFSEDHDQPKQFNWKGRDTIVGQEKDFATISDLLVSSEKKRLVIPITGLPGIGKTTLARSIYEGREVQNNFNIRAWVTVSQDFHFQEIYSKILNTMESKNYQAGHYKTQGDERTLFDRLHHELYNLKYLIVVDDVWNIEAWEKLSLALPDKENGSRIILTSRIKDVVASVEKDGYIHEMQPLGPEDSWKLLCYRVFDEDKGESDITKACPADLKETGRSVAQKCKGLPLSLTVVGGLLLQEKKKVDYWKRVEEDVSDASTKGNDSYLEILSLSYTYLPGKLKGCFLYLGAFPEDSEVHVSKLIKLWVAEGFPALPPTDPGLEVKVEDLEVNVEGFVNDLIGRNLISVRKKSANGGKKVCGMHDSLRDLAETESGFEKFFYSRKKYEQKLKADSTAQRRVSVHRNILMCLEEVYNSTREITLSRSLLYLGSHHHHPMPFVLTFDLLKVLDAFTVYFIQFPEEFLELLHLTYLSFTYNGKLPADISHLQKLQTLMVRREPKIIFVGASFLPDEIWEMPQLRHLWFTETDFPTLPTSRQNIVLLVNLQTLANVDAAYFTDEVLDNMPNLKKLSMWIESPIKLDFNVSKLDQLEHFKFVVLNPVPGKGIEVEAEHFFPKTLKRVTLSGCGLPWEYMKYVAENLVDLEVLKLKELAFDGERWCPKYRMKKLKYLLIEYLNFKTWVAGNVNYPSLERLILRHCYELDEVPENIKYIGPLELIEMVDCSPQAVESVEENIREENDSQKFKVRIFSSWE